MELSASDRNAIRETWKKRKREQIKKSLVMKREAMERAIEIARILKDRYKVEKVYLFGSLAAGDHFDCHSDIDIYITGWKYENKFWVMFSEMEMVARPYPLNIVTENEATDSLKKAVYEQGVLLAG